MVISFQLLKQQCCTRFFFEFKLSKVCKAYDLDTLSDFHNVDCLINSIVLLLNRFESNFLIVFLLGFGNTTKTGDVASRRRGCLV